MTETDTTVRPPLVLVANEQEWSVRSLESILGQHGYASVRAFTGRQALELCQRARPDVVIVDAGLSDISGFEVCQLLRDDPEFPHRTPIILTTAGPAGRAQRLDAYRAGAWEFVSQPVDAEALILKLSVYLRAKREMDRSNDESLIDSMTGLYSLRGLTKRAREIGADATRRKSPLSCIALGIDTSADSTGADIDPRIARHLGEVCRSVLRSSDAVGRLGSQEFAIIASETDGPGAAHLAERVCKTVDVMPLLVDGQAFRFKLVAGYCAVDDFSTSSVDVTEMMLRAATAMRHNRSAASPRSVTSFQDIPLQHVL